MRSPQVPQTKRKAEALRSRAQLAGLVVPKKVKTEANGGSEQVRVPSTTGESLSSHGGHSAAGTVCLEGS